MQCDIIILAIVTFYLNKFKKWGEGDAEFPSKVFS